MIVEGLMTTTSADGELNVAPMGPIVHGDFSALTLRPWAGSTTYNNLLATRQGVFHVVDHVTLIAEAAIRQLTTLPETFPAAVVEGAVLDDCCRWFEFRVTTMDTSEDRAVLEAETVHTGVRRPFRGFNRARHAVIEAAILATRVHLQSPGDIETQLQFLKNAVDRTGGPGEVAAFDMLMNHFQNAGVSVV